MSEEASQIAEKRREDNVKGEKERYTHLNAEFRKLARKDEKAFLSYQYKKKKKRKEKEKNRGKQQNGEDKGSLQEN